VQPPAGRAAKRPDATALLIQHEQGDDGPFRHGGRCKGTVVVKAQIPPKPDDDRRHLTEDLLARRFQFRAVHDLIWIVADPFFFLTNDPGVKLILRCPLSFKRRELAGKLCREVW